VKRVQFPSPLRLVLRIVGAVLLHRRLDFRKEAQGVIKQLNPPLQIIGAENIPETGPCVVTMNHYSRPGFQAWWMALAISAIVPAQIHWIMAAAWTTPKRWKAWWWVPFTSWVFQKVADTFGFSTMPPMPPNPQQVAWRAKSVRQVLRYVRDELSHAEGPAPLIGLAPEGGDMPGGVVSMPPSGTGRFIEQLARMGLQIAPVAVFIDEGGMAVNFGPPYWLDLPTGLTRDENDECVRRQVMSAIARLAPEEIQGDFRPKPE